MASNLYISGAEQGSGKSVVVLGAMDYLAGATGNVGFFRPVTRSDHDIDPLIRLVRQRYDLDVPYEAMYGCTSETARQLIAADRYDELLKRVLEKYRALQQQYDRILCVGINYSGVLAALEFDFNTDVANNLGCVIMPVIRGGGRTVSGIQDALAATLQAVEDRHGDIVATVVNGVEPGQLESLETALANANHGTAPVYILPEEPALARPTVEDIARALNVDVVHGECDCLSRTIRHFKVAAMQIPDFLDHIEADTFVITPGDRADIILACLTSYPSTAYPQIAGLLLTGGLEPAPQLVRLIAGMDKPPFAILAVDGDTFGTAMQVSEVGSRLSPDDDHKIAIALGLVESRIPFHELDEVLATGRRKRVTPLMFEYDLVQRAREQVQHIVLPEGLDERILRAADLLVSRGVVSVTLLGDPDAIQKKTLALGIQLDNVDIIDPLTADRREQYAQTYHAMRRHKGISEQMAMDAMADVSYFGTMMVHHGHADGMVSGAAHTTQHTIRPSFEIIKTRPGTAIVSSVFFMCLEDRVLVYGDCAVNPDPDAGQLADIAISSATTAQQFGVDPRIAMLSYSTGASGKGAAVDKVREATRLVRERAPDIMVEGPIQYDAAIDAGVAQTKLPDSQVAGSATVFIFPDLNTGNNTYKAVQRTSGAVAIGPVLQGLNKPVNDLSRGCTVTDIVNTVAITAVQAQASGHA